MCTLKPKVQQIQLDVISYPGGMRCTYAHQYAGNDMHIYICRQAYAETLGPTGETSLAMHVPSSTSAEGCH